MNWEKMPSSPSAPACSTLSLAAFSSALRHAPSGFSSHLQTGHPQTRRLTQTTANSSLGIHHWVPSTTPVLV